MQLTTLSTKCKLKGILEYSLVEVCRFELQLRHPKCHVLPLHYTSLTIIILLCKLLLQQFLIRQKILLLIYRIFLFKNLQSAEFKEIKINSTSIYINKRGPKIDNIIILIRSLIVIEFAPIYI